MTIYNIAGLDFKSKEAARGVAKEILSRYRAGDRVTGSDGRFMIEFLKTHSTAGQKIGAGIAYIYVANNDMPWPSKGFYVMRVDGTFTDFSYRECLKDAPDGDIVHFTEACRMAVTDQAMEVLKSSNIQGAHIHHDGKQFAEIVQDFIDEYRIQLNKVSMTQGDNVTMHKFLDKNIIALFQSYHRQKAHLVAITPEEHRTIPVKRFR